MLEPGLTIGQYNIIEKIGEGGMGAVFKARQAGVNRLVVIKVLMASTAGDAQMLERFKRELDIITALEHPHILPVYDFGQHDGQPFIVMRFMGGGSLLDRLHGRSLNREQMLRIFDQVASALDYAHDRGVVHRDLKPANVLLDSAEGGNAYLADFGLAKALEGGVNLTKTGSLMGTPAYMSPEQARGDKLDRRSDIYSLGVMAYEALAGQQPFYGKTSWELIQKHLTEAPASITAINPELPQQVEAIMSAALAKDPAERPQRATELVDSLRKLLSAEHGAAGIGVEAASRPGTQAAVAAPTGAPTNVSAGRVSAPPRAAPATVLLPQAAAVAVPLALVLAVAGALAFVLVLAVGAYLFRDSLFGPELATYPVGDSPRAALYDGQALWVANGFDNTLLKLEADCTGEPDTCGKVLGTYAVDDLPVGLAADGDTLWVASALHSQLTQVDASTGSVLGVFDLPNVPSALLFAHNSLWVANQFADSVTQLDRGGNVLGDHPVPGGPVALASGPSSIWVAAQAGHSVVRLDPRSGEIQSATTLDGEPVSLAASSALIWVALPKRDEVIALDARSGQITHRVSVSGAPSALLFDGQGVWAAKTDESSLALLDATSANVLQTIPLPAKPYTMAWSPCDGDCRHLWVVSESQDLMIRVRVP